MLCSVPAVWPSSCLQGCRGNPEEWKGTEAWGQGRPPWVPEAAVRCGDESGPGAPPSAASRLKASRSEPCHFLLAPKMVQRLKKKKKKKQNRQQHKIQPSPSPVSTTQHQPRKARSCLSPEDVTIETEIRATLRMLPPGKAIKCFLSIAVGKVTADKAAGEKWSGAAGPWELSKRASRWSLGSCCAAFGALGVPGW